MAANRAATRVDKVLGARMRARRVEMGLTQAVLAERLGITFQQVQKYESGSNRISVARLLGILAILRLEPSMFLRGLG